MPQGFLWQLVIVQPDIPQDGGLKFFAAMEVMGAQDVGDAPVEAFNHALVGAVVEPVNEQEVAANVALTMPGPVAGERVIKPLGR